MFGCGVSLGDVFCVPCHAPENTQLRMTFKLKMTVLRVSPVCCGLMGRVRESRPVSTRPRRPCPPFPLQSSISKGQWYKRLRAQSSCGSFHASSICPTISCPSFGRTLMRHKNRKKRSLCNVYFLEDFGISRFNAEELIVPLEIRRQRILKKSPTLIF